jgi:hypothetical protein
MDRRKALKNIGWGLGYAAATPAVFSLLKSCKEAAPTWTPEFFSMDEGKALTHLVDILLPKTDTPSASELGLHVFVDGFNKEVVPVEQQQFVKMLFGKFLEKSVADSGKETAADLNAEDLQATLATALDVDKTAKKAHNEAVAEFMEAVEAGGSPKLADETAHFTFADGLRNTCIWAFKNTEEIGKNQLAYLPVPGEYIACGDLNELTGGKAWTL